MHDPKNNRLWKIGTMENVPSKYLLLYVHGMDVAILAVPSLDARRWLAGDSDAAVVASLEISLHLNALLSCLILCGTIMMLATDQCYRQITDKRGETKMKLNIFRVMQRHAVPMHHTLPKLTLAN